MAYHSVQCPQCGIIIESGTSSLPAQEPTIEPVPDARPAERESRAWTSAKGNYTIDATFAGYHSGKVRLRKEDGKIIEVKLEDLSARDRLYVERQR